MYNKGKMSEGMKQTSQQIGSNLNDLDTNLESLIGRTVEQHAFIDAMKYVHRSAYPSTSATKEVLLELLLPYSLLHPSCLTSSLLYMNLLEILTKNGINVQRRQGLPVYQAIATALYSEDNALKSAADRMISDWRHSRSQASLPVASTSRQTDTQPGVLRPETESGWRRVDSAESRFPEAQKYSRILGESLTLTEARRAYLTYCDQKDFPRADRVKLFSCILKGPALNYWTLHIDQNPDYTELGAVFAKLESQFDTPAHQRQVEAMAQNLSMELTRQKHTCGRVAALGILYHEVARLNQLFPKEKRGPAFRTQTLLRIVEKYEWSRTAEEEVMRNPLSYDDLYTKLSASLVVWEREVARAGHDPSTADDNRHTKANVSFIGYGSQYAYPRDRANRGRTSSTYVSPSKYYRSRPPRPPSSRFAIRRNTSARCFKCGKAGHFRRECKETEGISMADIVRSRIREQGGDPNATAAAILYELVSEEDIFSICSSTALEEDGTAENVFESLVNEESQEQDDDDEKGTVDNGTAESDGLHESTVHFQDPDRH